MSHRPLEIGNAGKPSCGANELGSILVVIPAMNEEFTVGVVVENVRSVWGVDVVVIDDASSDNTAKVAREAGAIVVPLMFNLGPWGAMQAGFRYALRKGYDIVVTMDGDGQHPVEHIFDLVKPISERRADVTIGSYLPRLSVMRRIAGRFFRNLSRLPIRDFTSGFRAYHRKVLPCLVCSEMCLLDYQDLGALLLLYHKGFKVLEVPVYMEFRKFGKSRVFYSWREVFRYLVHTSILGLARRR